MKITKAFDISHILFSKKLEALHFGNQHNMRIAIKNRKEMKNIRKIGNGILMAGMLLFGTTGCLYETLPTPKIEVPDNDVSFSQEVIPIFDASCNGAGCHAAGAIPPDLSPANAYNAMISGGYIDTDNPESSEFYTKIAPGGSMERFITTEETGIILGWIQQGAQNN